MEIIGHQHVLDFLKKSAEIDKISHAFLFFGPEKIGKKTVAIEFIKFLNCREKDIKKRPCQSCFFCKEIEKKSHPDFILIEPEKKEIQIGQIKKLSWGLSLHAYSAPFKAAIIDEAHLMNEEAQNSLLKTLEEPKGKTVIILVTAFPELLFPTIVSRTKRIKFSFVAKSEIEKYLKKQGISEGESKKLFSVSSGKPGEIIDFLSNSIKLKERNQKINELKELFNSPLSLRFKYADELVKNPENINETLSIWLRYFRNYLHLILGQPSEAVSYKKIKKIINLIQDINFLISKTEINSKLALEMILIEL